MNAQQPVVEEARMARARAELTVATLPITVWINPTWAALTALPFIGLFPIFGTVAWWRIALVLALHIVNSFVAAALYRDARRGTEKNPHLWLKRLVAFQAVISVEWGLLVWLLWEPGNDVNHVMIVMSIVALFWAYTFSRAMHSGVYLAGVAPTAVLTLGRLCLGGDASALPLALFFSVTFVFAFLFAFRARRYFETMLKTRFANDDLAVELRATRDDALRKRFEAEAANASKTTFLANMSHELRTPLNAILGFSELIAHETLGPIGTKRYREYATDINSSGSHLLSLINDILDVAKIEAGKMDIEPRAVDPKSTIEKALVIVAARAREKRQHLSVEIAASGPSLYADERAVKQIVINLSANAVKFTPEGGKIVISGGPTADGGYEICVEDDGPGISPELLERVFLPFNQVDNRYSRQVGGTGLGLSLVRGLAELHGGRAWIESDVGAGVRAYVYFPVGNALAPRSLARKSA
ncbi:MAG TPA: ATP-binding protein [Rhizomicrobium sp.]|jgi:two-component system cell cycle sensor histidine kinase PleC|nr:ATP-binding protein [Rhizomicrobium sp.]